MKSKNLNYAKRKEEIEESLRKQKKNTRYLCKYKLV